MVLVIVAKVCFGSSFTIVNLLIDDVFGSVNGTLVYSFAVFALVAGAFSSPNVVSIWWTEHQIIRPFYCVCYGVAAAGLCAIIYLHSLKPRNPSKEPPRNRRTSITPRLSSKYIQMM